MRSDRKYLIMAVIFGLITVILISVYLGSLERLDEEEAVGIEVVVARVSIPPYTVIEEEMLDYSLLPLTAVHPDAILHKAEIVGKITRTEVIKGEQVLAGRVITEFTRTHFSYSIPDGMRAIAIPVNEISGVGGYIVPGDRVDVLISYTGKAWGDKTVTYTTFQNVVVLAAGKIFRETEEKDPEVVSTVILAVEPAKAEVLAFATLEGSFHLTLRFPADLESKTPSSYSIDNFRTYGDR